MSVTIPQGAALRSVADILYYANALRRRTVHDGHDMEPISFSAQLVELFKTLESRQIKFLLVGGVALLQYIEGRNTQDIDLLLSVAALPRIPEITLVDQNRDFARGHFESVQVDLLLSENPMFALVQERYATIHRFKEMDVPTATVEGLIILKLHALPDLYRRPDIQRAILYENDITMLAQRHKPDLKALLTVVKPYVDAAAFGDLELIISEIQTKLARLQKR